MINTIKVIVIFGIVTPFFPVCSMTENNFDGGKADYYVVKEDGLEQINPLSCMKNLPMKGYFYSPLSKLKIRRPEPFRCNKSDRGLALIFTAAKLLGEPNEVKEKEILKTVKKAASEGISVTSKYNVDVRNGCFFDFVITHTEEPTSIFRSIDNLLGDSFPLFIAGTSDPAALKKDRKKRQWMKAFFEGEGKLACIPEILTVCARDKLSIEIPEDLVTLIISYLSECCINEGRTILIKGISYPFKDISYLFSENRTTLISQKKLEQQRLQEQLQLTTENAPWRSWISNSCRNLIWMKQVFILKLS